MYMGVRGAILYYRASQLLEFDVASCRTFRLRSKKAILEVSTSKMTRLWAKLGSLHADLTPPNVNTYKRSG